MTLKKLSVTTPGNLIATADKTVLLGESIWLGAGDDKANYTEVSPAEAQTIRAAQAEAERGARAANAGLRPVPPPAAGSADSPAEAGPTENATATKVAEPESQTTHQPQPGD